MPSGIASGSASIVISRVTCSRMPPSLTPGILGALELDRDVGLDRDVEVDLLAVEVHEVAADRVALLLLDDDRDGSCALDLEVEERVALADEEREVVGVGLEGARGLPARVDDAGDQALAAQAAGGAGAERGAFGDLELGRDSGHADGAG